MFFTLSRTVLWVLCCVVLSVSAIRAQDILMGQAARVDQCGGRLLDSGGPDRAHAGAGQRETITLCSDAGPERSHLSLQFRQLDIAGQLVIHNGSSTDAPVLRTLTAADNGTRFTVSATAANPTGCLTVVFTSSGSRPGWEAGLSCGPACQPILVELVESTPTISPPTEFLDVCLGETLTLTARGRYPESGTAYEQQDATTTFSWEFQDGTRREGPSVSYVHRQPGGYLPTLTLRDQRGCTSTNLVLPRIRVAGPPTVLASEPTDPEVCPGDTLTLSTEPGTGDRSYTAEARTYQFTGVRQPAADRFTIPETAGELRSSPLPLRGYGADRLISDGDDLLEVCLDIEHSYIGDLSIWIECPNGGRVDLMRYDPNQQGATGQYFGQPTTGTGTEAGTAGRYCWSPRATQTVDEVARGRPPLSPLPESIRYRPVIGSFDNLSGCPLDGDWQLYVRDEGAGDGGTLFNWSITFADGVAPPVGTYQFPIVGTEWIDDGTATQYSGPTVDFASQSPGRSNLTLRTTDSIGCTFDTLFPVLTRSSYAPECFTCGPAPAPTRLDTLVCTQEPFVNTLTTDLVPPRDTVRWTVRANQALPSDAEPYHSELTVTDHFPEQLSEVTDELLSVCVNYRSAQTLENLNLSLVSPSGNRLPLVAAGTLSAASLVRCFTPANTANWDLLRGTLSNGTWSLEFAGLPKDAGDQLISWSIDLVRVPPITYSWSPASPDFSCTDCATPTITPTQEGTYTLRATTADGCRAEAELRLRTQSITAAFEETITPTCFGTSNASIDLTRVRGGGPLTYSWSNGAKTRDLEQVPAGTYTVTVTAVNGCSQTQTYPIPPVDSLRLRVTSAEPAACFGTATGTINTAVRGGLPPYDYRWSTGIRNQGGVAGGLPAGTYGVTVTDAIGCSDTTSARITQPSRLGVTIGTTPVDCRNEATGTLALTARGGSPGYTFRWADGPRTPRRTNLPAADYPVQVQDANGCTLDTVARLEQPEALFLAIVTDSVGPCREEQNGQASVFASGTDILTYRWSSGETTPRATALTLGTNSVTVTDVNGCVREQSFTLSEREEVVPELVYSTENVCDSNALKTLALAQDYTAYEWSTGDTLPTISDLSSGATYAVTVTTALGCQGVDSFTYRALPPVTFEVATTPVRCFGSRTGSLEVLNIRSPIAGDFTYRWDESADLARTPRVDNLLAGTYSVTLTNGDSCRVDTTVRVFSPPLLTLRTRKSDISCFGANDGSIRATVTGGTEPYVYSWSTGSSAPALSDLSPGEYNLVVTDVNGCTEQDTLSFTEPVAITVSAATTSGICGGEASGRIDIDAQGGQAPYRYGLNNSQLGISPSFIGLNEGVYTVNVRDAAGCTARTEIEVMDGPALTLDLGPDLQLVFGDSVQLGGTIEGATGPIDYFWEATEPNTLSCVDCANPVAHPPYAVTYTLAIMDSLGCEADDRLQVAVAKIREVAVPTGFTPDGDGQNDRLLVHGRPGTQVLEFIVFDRWGGVVYADQRGSWPVNDPSRGWDGQSPTGDPYTTDVYFYKLVVRYEDGSEETLNGQTTLIR